MKRSTPCSPLSKILPQGPLVGTGKSPVDILANLLRFSAFFLIKINKIT